MVDDVLTRILRGLDNVNAPDDLPPWERGDDKPTAEVAKLRVPPHSIEAEQSVLGVLIIDASAFAAVADIISVADFYRHEHRLIFSAIEALISEAAPADPVSVFERLQRDDKAALTGGLAYLSQLAQSVPSVASVKRYAEIVRERATLRAIIATADETAARAFSNDAAEAILDDTKVKLGHLAEARNFTSKRVPLLKPDQLREVAHAQTWLVKRVIPAVSIGLLFGASGTFKSFLALDLALHVVHGLPWLGRKTTKGAVIYIAAEGASGLWPRFVAWHRERRLRYDDIPFYTVPMAVNLGTDAWRVVEAAQSAGVAPAMVVVDTMSQTYRGEENSANEVAAYLGEISNRIKLLWQCAVMIIHHTGHSSTERPRGSSALQANTDYLYGVFRDEREMLASLTCVHRKDGEPFEDIPFALGRHVLGTDEDSDEITSLVARHLSDVEAVQEAMEAESKAGRGGANHLFVSLLQNGQLESELRTTFYRDCKLDNPDSRKKAYQRARSWAIKNGLMEVAEGYVLVLKAGQKS